MKTKPVLLSALFIVWIFPMKGQDSIRLKSLYVETGMDFTSCYAPDNKDYIRGDVNPNPYYYEPGYLMALLYRSYAGVKGEIRVLNNKLGLISGLRFTHMQGSLGKNDYWSTRTDFFYLLYKQDGLTTEYLKVKEITQITNYLGIPVEIRIYPYRQRGIQMYYKFGADFNVLLSGTTNVKFDNPAMQLYENDVTGIIEDPWPFYASIHVAAGLKLGKDTKPGINIEACLPSGFLFKHMDSSFVTPDFGGGFQMNIRIPF